MKEITWDNTLSIAVEEVDEDHRKLVDVFNILAHAVEDGEAREYVAAVLTELLNCTVWHFSHEERLMLKYGYPGLGEHKVEHQELIASAKELEQKFEQAGQQLTTQDIEYLEHWLTGHIFGADMQLGEYLVNAM